MAEVTPYRKAKFLRLTGEGMTVAEAAARAGISESTAYRLRREIVQERAKKAAREEAASWTENRRDREGGSGSALAEAELPGPIPPERLKAEARRALEDFGYFRLRYFGRGATPWQEEAAYQILGLLGSPDREYVVMNVPPGSGKTTLMHDITCWLIARDRSIRIITGSATSALASRNLMRVRRSLERVRPVKGDSAKVATGHEFDALATLAGDYGRFKPLDRELWTRDAFVVMQFEDRGAIEDKEPTVSAYGVDSGFIGGRYDFSLWDDLVDPRRIRSSEQAEALEDWYVDACETRLEPGGLHLLVGQRLASDDLYRFALDMLAPEYDDDGAIDTYERTDEEIAEERLRPDEDRTGKKYKRIVYKAHYEDRCAERSHRRDAVPYPQGCLLDPHRLPYRELAAIQANRARSFSVVYQQEDVDRQEVLIPREWITGGGDFVGCMDHDRDRWEIPPGILRGESLVVATADPSPTQFWSIQCWLYHEPSKQRFLLDHVRAKMDVTKFLDYNPVSREYSGIMHEWQNLSEALGWRIQYWIVEQNAAQRFMLQYAHVRTWRIAKGVDIIGHTTSVNKADPNYGISTLKQHYRFGRVRLPGKGEGKLASLRLVDEVTRYPHGRTDDCVMAQWMFEWNLPRLNTTNYHTEPAERPSWLTAENF